MGQESISATSRLTILNVQSFDGGSDANLVFHRIFGRREVLKYMARLALIEAGVSVIPLFELASLKLFLPLLPTWWFPPTVM